MTGVTRWLRPDFIRNGDARSPQLPRRRDSRNTFMSLGALPITQSQPIAHAIFLLAVVAVAGWRWGL
jgi:hypothetical protein